MALVGMMGAGKSTVGPLLALALGLAFEDSDTAIELRVGMSVAACFERHGESHFRAEERRWIHSLTARPAAVLSLGGGLVLGSGRAERLRELARTIYLAAPPEELTRRLGPGAVRERPLLRGRDPREGLGELLRAREERYLAAADLVIQTTGLGPEQVAAIAAVALAQL